MRRPAHGTQRGASVELEEASLQAPEGLLDLMREIGEGENGFRGERELLTGELTLEAFLGRLVAWSAGRDLPAGWVPFTTFWLLDRRRTAVGLSRLRHRLNAALLEHGGHIGYYVKASERGKGYGRAILALTLEEARRLGLERVLLTVDSGNQPSVRVIEANGGVLEDERTDPESGRPFRRYWIGLGPTPTGG